MQILNLRPSGAGSLLALFDLAATREITLHDWQLRQTANGLRVFPPSPRSGRSSATVSWHTIQEIRDLAAAAYRKGDAPNDRNSEAA